MPKSKRDRGPKYTQRTIERSAQHKERVAKQRAERAKRHGSTGDKDGWKRESSSYYFVPGNGHLVTMQKIRDIAAQFSKSITTRCASHFYCSR
ncbi:hypothetical protein ACMFMF_002030 [Clarireedia jacksonii]